MKNLLFLLILTTICSSLAAQHLHRVNNNTDFDADFTTLQAAVTAASNNDTIFVEGSPTEYEGATINKPLTIVGPGFFLGENPKTQANTSEATFISAIIFDSGSDGSTIMGCVISYADLTVNEDDITIIRNHIYDITFPGTSNNVVIAQNYITHRIIIDVGVISNAVISNNIFRGRINSENTSGPLIISNNVFCSTSYNFPVDCYNANIQNNILILEEAIIEINTGNSISYNILAGAGTNSNGNQYNVDMNTVFADFDGSLGHSTDAKWLLRSGSPALDAGIGGVDCGAFGGAMPYVLSGMPDLPHIYEANVSGSATTESGLHVTISVKSGN